MRMFLAVAVGMGVLGGGAASAQEAGPQTAPGGGFAHGLQRGSGRWQRCVA